MILAVKFTPHQRCIFLMVMAFVTQQQNAAISLNTALHTSFLVHYAMAERRHVCNFTSVNFCDTLVSDKWLTVE